MTKLIDGLGTTMPIVATSLDTSETTRALTSVRGRLQKDSPRKVATALALFDERVDGDVLLDRLEVARTTAVTPLMFEHQLIDMAVADRRHIVLPEGDDDRILQAADIVLRRRIADLTILGEAREVQTARGPARRGHLRLRRCSARPTRSCGDGSPRRTTNAASTRASTSSGPATSSSTCRTSAR